MSFESSVPDSWRTDVSASGTIQITPPLDPGKLHRLTRIILAGRPGDLYISAQEIHPNQWGMRPSSAITSLSLIQSQLFTWGHEISGSLRWMAGDQAGKIEIDGGSVVAYQGRVSVTYDPIACSTTPVSPELMRQNDCAHPKSLEEFEY
jgi:hypothetical protein